MFENNQTCWQKLILLQYSISAGNLCKSCCLVQQQSRLMCMLVLFIAGICLELSSLEPYLCMGLTVDCECRCHCTKQKLSECNIIALAGIMPSIEGHVIEVSAQHLWAENKS